MPPPGTRGIIPQTKNTNTGDFNTLAEISENRAMKIAAKK